ncbi:MAG: tetratricopeptide repeat protein [Gemmatimonadales bacterium]
MTPFRLVTLDRVALLGPLGPVVLADSRHLAVLVRLAVAPGRSLATNELLLDVWPHLTPQQGARELANAASTIATAAGAPLVTAAADRWTLDPSIECDVARSRSDAAASFAAGFRLPETPEWDQWVSGIREEIARRPAPGARPRPWRAALALAVIGSAVGVGYLVTRPRAVAGFTPGDRVILADVARATADSILGRSLQVAAVVGLEPASRIELFPRGRILESLRAVGRPLDSAGLTVDRALELAVREGVPWVVAIGIEPDRDRTRVTTRLIRTGTREPVVTTRAEAVGVLDLVEAVGETIRTLLERLGEPRQALREQPTLAFATSADLNALRAYTEGTAAWSRGEYHLARDYWARAVTLDTGFAMAMGSLGSYYYYHHHRAEGERYFQSALARTDRLTEWERLQVEQRYAGWRGDRDSAVILVRQIATTFPRASTYFSLGTVLLQAGRCSEGLEALERSRQLDPADSKTHINIATCEKALRRYDRARLAYLAADRLDSTALFLGNVNLEFAGATLLAGRVTEAESALTRMTRRPGMSDQALGFRGLGFLALWRGEIARAGEQFRRAAALSRQQRAANSLLRNLALLAATQRAAGASEERRRTLAAVDSLAALPGMAPGFLVMAVEPHADDGNSGKIRTLHERIRARADARNREDSLQIHYVAGVLALAERDPAAALAAFDRAEGVIRPASMGYRRALAYQQLGQLDSARRVLAASLLPPRFGTEEEDAWIRSLVEIGLVEERLGRYDDAIASYRRFLEQWKDADPGLPDVALIRGRLNALLARHDR